MNVELKECRIGRNHGDLEETMATSCKRELKLSAFGTIEGTITGQNENGK